MKIGFAQMLPKLLDLSGNLEKIKALMTSEDYDVLVFPELATTGYVFENIDEVWNVAMSVDELVDFVTSVKRPGLIVIGFAEKYGDKLFNSSVAITPEGDYYLYRKIHLFDREKLWFSPGNLGFTVFDWRGYKFGMMICFDWIFPEAMRTLAVKGADLVLHSANLVLPYCQNAMTTRCLENHVFAITANRIGEERGVKFTGMSQITGVKGDILLRYSPDGEGLGFVEVNLFESRDKRIATLNNIMLDRRPEWYLDLTRGV
ncbi:acyltransferase [bacterium 3DAC]|nr:acyltransferase [Dictyoglomota bacterium]UZN22830.1 acyltransferase [bacterium 3DAC]